MLDTLVAGVAHELNNKLTPVVGFADLLEMVAGSQHTMEVRGIRQCALEASQIIKQLLQLSRPADRDHGPVDLRAIVTDTIEILRYQIRTGRCELTVDLPKAEALVLGAPAQLKQVLVNLVLNAVHAMETSANRRLGVGVRVYPGEVELFVADSGCGIPSENLHRIFDPFFTTKSPDRGTGLGLSISQSLVRQHEGEIRVQSDVGRGTTFKVVLPRVQHQAPATEAPAPPARTSDGAVPADPSRRLQVLVVDDENFVRQFLQEAIRTSFPCSVDAACDGLDAVARLERTDYDLVVSDIRMPRMDGLQLRDWICRNRPSLAARLVFVTGHAGAIELTTDLAALAMPVLRKPFTVEAIRDTCRPLLLGAN
jgi:two-component system NtrC family sensor kinase